MSDKPLEATFEEMTVSPTPGSPVLATGGGNNSECPPKDKVTFHVEITFKDQLTKKAVRILPTSSMHDFLDKLTKKKYLPTSSMLGGNQLKSEQIIISFGMAKDYTVPLPISRWSEPLWGIGFRDKDTIVIVVDPNPPQVKFVEPALTETESKRKTSDEKHGTLMSRFTRRSIKPQVHENEEEEKALLFGVPIEEVASNGTPLMSEYAIPAFIDESLKIIRDKHTGTEGIFRLSGSLNEIKTLKKKIDSGTAPPFDYDVDVHVLTGLIKLYLRELPEPLLTHDLFDCWKAVSECELKEKKVELVKALLIALPKPNYTLLKRLMVFLVDIASFEKATKMGLVNLATLIGPNLIWSKDSNDISTPMKITWFMFMNIKYLFEEEDCRSTILLSVGRAKYDFTPEDEGEIPLRAGDIVFVTSNEAESQGWLEGMPAKAPLHGKCPSKYIEILAYFHAPEAPPAIVVEEVPSEPSSESPSLVPSSVQMEGINQTVESLKKELEEEKASKKELATRVDSLETRFKDLLDIMVTMKNNIKEIQLDVDDMAKIVFEEEPADP